MATLYLKVPNGNIGWDTLSNWYEDSNCTIPATSLPISSDDVVILTTTNTERTITLQSQTTVNNLTVEGFRNSKNSDRSTYSIIIARQGFQNIALNINNMILNNSSVNFQNLPNNINQIDLNGYSYLSNGAQNSSIFSTNININDFSILDLFGSNIQNVIFNDNSSYFRLDLDINNITFNDNSDKIPSSLGLVTGGNITLTNNIYNYDDSFPLINASVSGNIIFNSGSPVNFTLNDSNSWTLDSSVWTFSSSSPPSWTFNNTSSLNGGNLVGNATFNDSSFQTGNSIVSNSSIVTFNEDSYQAGKITNGSITYDGFNGTNNSGYFVNGQKITYIGIPVTVSNSAIFNNSSVHGGSLTGNATFNNSSFNVGIITGDASFNNNSSNYNPNNINIAGYVTGSITCNTTATYCPYAPRILYFNGAADGDWNNLNNWWTDSGATIQAFFLPTSIDSVIASAGISTNSGSPPTIVNFTTGGTYGMYITLTVSGTATFNDSSHNDGTLTGNATFNDTSSNAGTLNGPHNFIFNDSSYNDTLGTINYSAIFNDYSYNDGSVDPGSVNNPVIFNDNSYNNNSIVWAAIFNNSSYNVALITGNVIFNHNSYMEDSGSITGDAVFNNESSNRTNISGSVILNPDRGINGSSILGLI